MSRWVWRLLLSCFVCGVTQTVSLLVVVPSKFDAGRNPSTLVPRYTQNTPQGDVASDDPRHVILKSGGSPSQRSNRSPYQIVPISQFFQLGYTLQDINSLTSDTAAILLSQRVPRPSAPLPVTWVLSSSARNSSSTKTTSTTPLDESGLLVATNKSQAQRLVADLTQSTTNTASCTETSDAKKTSDEATSKATVRDTTPSLNPATSRLETPTKTLSESYHNQDTSMLTTSSTPFLQVSPQEFGTPSTTPMTTIASTSQTPSTTAMTQTLERESLNIVSTPNNPTENTLNDLSVLLYTDWQGNLTCVPTANLTRLGYSWNELRRLHTTALDRIVLGQIVRPHQGIPIRWNSILGEEETVEWVPTMQVAQAKLERHQRIAQQQKIRLQQEEATKKDRGDPPPPKSSWLVDMRTYRKQLRESAAFRLKWLGKSWAPWIQQEANLRLDLYKNFLWMWHDYVEGDDDGYQGQQ